MSSVSSLVASIEAVLFACGRALTIKKLVELTSASDDDVRDSLEHLGERLAASKSGLQLTRNGNEVELTTHADTADIVRLALQTEQQGELTRPSLEALAVLAYRGPLTRPELESIRGVQSALILRNLQMRGLVEVQPETRLGQPVYSVTMDLLKFLGLDCMESLPHYDELRSTMSVEQVLQGTTSSSSNTTSVNV